METVVVEVMKNFFDYFFMAQGSYWPPTQNTQPISFLKTDKKGLLYVLEDCSQIEASTQFDVTVYQNGKTSTENMTFAGMQNFLNKMGDNSGNFANVLSKLQRFVRFDEFNTPPQNRKYSPAKVNIISYTIPKTSIGISFPINGCFLTQITDWDKNFVFISYFNTRDFGSRIASLSEIKKSFKGEDFSKPSFYFSDDRKSLYLGTLDNGNIIPAVYSENVSTNLPNSFFITCQSNLLPEPDITKIIDTRSYNSSYGPIMTSLTNINGNPKNYVFLRIPLLYITSIMYNFPTNTDNTFNPLPISLSNVFRNNWNLATVEDIGTILTANTQVSGYNVPLSSFNIVLADGQYMKQYSISGNTLTLADNRGGANYLLWIAKGSDWTGKNVAEILDLSKVFGKVVKTPPHHPSPSSSRSRLVLFIIVGGIVALLLILFIIYKIKSKRLSS
jgi:hypothetical protein